ncbi:hypothetical protein EDC01DRAFT_635922 [Geopyxis carbonaria]|nr:hypothetical protein EDC01DRAFT_635922 [Geopyxis carbonaria]
MLLLASYLSAWNSSYTIFALPSVPELSFRYLVWSVEPINNGRPGNSRDSAQRGSVMLGGNSIKLHVLEVINILVQLRIYIATISFFYCGSMVNLPYRIDNLPESFNNLSYFHGKFIVMTRYNYLCTLVTYREKSYRYFLYHRAKEEWDLIPQEDIDNLIYSMLERMQAVIDNNGGHTKW